MKTRCSVADRARNYVDYLQAKGISVKVADVLFVMGAASVFAKLRAGVSHLHDAPKFAKNAIRSALTRAPDYLGHGANGRVVVSWTPEQPGSTGLSSASV